MLEWQFTQGSKKTHAAWVSRAVVERVYNAREGPKSEAPGADEGVFDACDERTVQVGCCRLSFILVLVGKDAQHAHYWESSERLL